MIADSPSRVIRSASRSPPHTRKSGQARTGPDRPLHFPPRGLDCTPDAINCCPSGMSSTRSAKSECSRGINCTPDAMNSTRSAMLSTARAGEPGHRVAIGPLPRKGAWHMTDTAVAAGIDAHRRSDGASAIAGCPSRRRAVAGWPGNAGCGSRSGRVGALRVVLLTPAGTRAPACSGSPPGPAATPPPPRFPRPAPRSAASSSRAAAPSR